MALLISLDKAIYDEMYDAAKAAAAKIQELEAKLDQQTMLIAACDPAVPAQIAALAETCKTVVSYAVANMDPLSFRGWPTVALKRFAQIVNDLPTATPADRECAHAYTTFAAEVERVEEFRRQGREAELGTPARGLRARIEELETEMALLRGAHEHETAQMAQHIGELRERLAVFEGPFKKEGETEADLAPDQAKHNRPGI